MRPPTPAGGPRRVYGSTPMVLPPPIVKLFSREARIFFEPYVFVKRHVKKITTPASKCCKTFDQTGVRQQTRHQIEAHEVVYPMRCHVELSTWNTVAKRRNQDAEVPPKKAERAKRPRLFLPTDKKASFMARYVQVFFFYSLPYCLPSIAVAFLHP